MIMANVEYNKVEYKDNMGAFGRAVKRMFDVVMSAFLLVLASPVFVVIYVVLRCENDCSPFFSQERVGKGGRVFMIRKFRTMSGENGEDDTPLLATDDDERLTCVGRWLRAHHLDELPQLWNVLVGDMSFVGYRPERRFFIDQIMQHNTSYECLYQIQPGVTSPATLYNGYTDNMDKMLRRLDMDIEYLTKRTLWLDCKIIFLTAWFTVSGRRF